MAHPSRRMRQERESNLEKQTLIMGERQKTFARQVRLKELDKILRIVGAIASAVCMWCLVDYCNNNSYAALAAEVTAHDLSLRKLEACRHEYTR